jgi:hypothetical protein
MADELAGGSQRPSWRPSRRHVLLISAVVVVVAAVVTTVVIWPTDHDQPAARQQTPLPCPLPAEAPQRSPHLTALALPAAGATLERHVSKPHRWTTVIYGSKGGFGGGEAVITYPLGRPQRGPSYFSWRAGKHWVVAHGFLSVPTSYLRRFVHISHGRPVVRGLAGYRLTVTVPAEPVVTREIRYDAGQLGAAGEVLGGLVFTGVTRTGALDDWIVAGQPPQSGTVDGAPAVVTTIFGGNAALAWEPTAGTVAYIGYSGASLSSTTVAALHCLAEQSRSVSHSQWHPRAGSVVAP